VSNPDDDVQDWFSGLSYKVKRKLAATLKEEAEGLRAAIEEVAPKGDTGNLAVSVKVRRKKNELDLEVTAGGDLTTKTYGRGTDYDSAVVVDGRDNSGKSKVAVGQGSGVTYDYALASEFGTSKEEAQPFFYPTFRARQAGIRQAIDDAVDEAINS
jgi:HK97 gp10 family phage protein